MGVRYGSSCLLLHVDFQFSQHHLLKRLSSPHWEEFILLKCPYHPKPSIESVPSLSQFQWYFSQKQKKQSWNLYRATKNTQIPKTILRTKHRARGIILLDSKLYYKAIVTNTVCHSSKTRHTGHSLSGLDSALSLPWPGFNPCSGN